MYFHVYLIYRFTRTFTDHSSVITRCWGFELQNGKSSLKSPQTLATQDFAPASFLSTPDKKKPCNRNGYRASSLLSRYEGKIGLDTDLDTAVLFSQQCLQRIGRRTLIFLQSMSVNIKSNAGMSMTEPFRNRSNIRFRRDQERC